MQLTHYWKRFAPICRRKRPLNHARLAAVIGFNTLELLIATSLELSRAESLRCELRSVSSEPCLTSAVKWK